MNDFLSVKIERPGKEILDGRSNLTKKSLEIQEVDDVIITFAREVYQQMKRMKYMSASGVIFGQLLRIIIIDQENEQPLFLINPKIISKGDEFIEQTERCILFPDTELVISRPKQIEIQYTDLEKCIVKLKPKSDISRLILHELDHLNGSMFFENLPQEKQEKFIEENITDNS